MESLWMVIYSNYYPGRGVWAASHTPNRNLYSTPATQKGGFSKTHRGEFTQSGFTYLYMADIDGIMGVLGCRNARPARQRCIAWTCTAAEVSIKLYVPEGCRYIQHRDIIHIASGKCTFLLMNPEFSVSNFTFSSSISSISPRHPSWENTANTATLM